MKEWKGKQVQLNYGKTAKENYLIISLREEEKLQELQMEQLSHNSFPGLLEFDTRFSNHQVHFYYNITEKVALQDWMKGKKLTKQVFFQILQGIVKILLQSTNYMIYDKNFMLDPQTIYLNTRTQDVFIAYLPVETEGNVKSNLETLVLEFLSQLERKEFEDNLLLSLKNYFKQEGFHLQGLDQLLYQLRNMEAPIPEVTKQPQTKEGISKVISRLFNKKEKSKSSGKTPPQSEFAIEEKEQPKPPQLKVYPQETVLLGEALPRIAYLKGLSQDHLEEITISKPSFIVGRFEPQVDYLLKNKYVGRLHSEIQTREGVYFLKDLNSQNGTFLNGERIQSHQEYEIKNGDNITFADAEFVFQVL